MKEYKYDVVVAGGGPAGVCAAVSAARGGAKVLLVEQYGCLGGMSTMGLVAPWMTFHDDDGNQVVKGIGQEIVDLLMERGMSFNRRIDPQRTITRGEFADLCGLERPAEPNAALTRQTAAQLLEPALSDKTLAYLVYTDLDDISGSAFQSVQMCVASGIFSHAEGLSFRPSDEMTWGEAAATALRYLENLDKIEEAPAEEAGSEPTEESGSADTAKTEPSTTPTP